MGFTSRAISLAAFIFLCFDALSAVPGSISYQAYVTDSNGAALDGIVDLTFTMYAVPSGGSPLWINGVDGESYLVSNGLVSAEIGGPGSPFPPDLFDTPVWLGIGVNGDDEMVPRRPFTSAGFAFKADDALSLQGQGPAAFDQSAHTVSSSNPHAVSPAQIGAATSADLDALQTQLDGALASIALLQSELLAANQTIATLQSDLDNEVAARIADVDAEQAARLLADAAQDTTIGQIQANSVLALDGALTLSGGNTALFTGVNVQVINGLGSTLSDPNGVGNVIVGYDELATTLPICSFGEFDNQLDCESGGGLWASNHKTGSHNVVIGRGHSYSRHSGLVAGLQNDIIGAYASVLGGSDNSARGLASTISGGAASIASGVQSSVSGGFGNNASGAAASVTGGASNESGGLRTTAIGGDGVQCSVNFDFCGEGIVAPPD